MNAHLPTRRSAPPPALRGLPRWRVLKYAVTPGEFIVTAPPLTGRSALAVQVQDGEPRLWMLVDVDTPPGEYVDVHFSCVGTGHDVPFVAYIRHVGTFQLDALVYHLFETGETAHVPTASDEGAS